MSKEFQLDKFDMSYHIRQSNLIEQVNSTQQDKIGLDAWTWLIEQPCITETLIRSLHYMITKDLLPYHLSGVWRPYNVTVGGRLCPLYKEVPSLMSDWIGAMDDLSNTDPKTMHIEFEKIHPFADGNGRVGRMLMWYHEYNLNTTPTLIEYVDRWEYYDWFRNEEDICKEIEEIRNYTFQYFMNKLVD